jgi:uncharacterized membrane protein (DUF373 family)
VLVKDGVHPETRSVVSRALARVQALVYVGLAALLSVSAMALLVHGGIDLVRAVIAGVDVRAIVTLLDRVLLALMVVELLYTVEVSFREHALLPEPFLLVALIAAVRRILVITAEFGAQMRDMEEEPFRHVMWELALLTGLIVVLVASVVILRRRAPQQPRELHTPEESRKTAESHQGVEPKQP